jgi:hypothetical protein
MFCQYCGVALSKQMKYCTHCGAQLIAKKDAAEIEPSKRQMDPFEWLVWLSVWGLGLILGGMVLMKKVQLSTGLIIAYMILSSLVFLILFGLSLVGMLSSPEYSNEAEGAVQIGPLDTNELDPADERPTMEALSSVTESTTRRLEPVSNKQVNEISTGS